jgi:hypothetical protein
MICIICLLGVLFFQSFALRKHQVVVTMIKPAIEAHLKLPSFWASARGSECKLFINEASDREYANLYYGFFELPIMITFLSETEIGVLYDYDVDIYVLVFSVEKTQNNMEYQFNKSIGQIVSHTTLSVRMGTSDDMRRIIDKINKMPENEYAKCSVPRLDLGLFRVYAERESVVKRIYASLGVEEENSGVCPEWHLSPKPRP